MRSVAVGALLLVSCRSAGPSEAISTREVVEISPSSGAVSAKLLQDPDAPQVQLGPNEEFVPPRLRIVDPKPNYPPELLPLNLPRHVVSVRVVFDEGGEAIGVVESPLGGSTGGEYAPQFQAAVRQAVSEWSCWPASIRKFRAGRDLDGDGTSDYRILVAQKRLKTFFDLAFSFEVVNGQPVVKRTE